MNKPPVQAHGLSPWRVLKYAAGYTIPAVVALSFLSDGPFTWWAIAYGFGVLPLLEMVLPPSSKNLSKAEREWVSADKTYDMMLWSMVLIQYALLAWFLWDMSHGTRAVSYTHLTLPTILLV